MAFRTASFALRRMMSTSTPRTAEMSFTFAAPNAVHYNKASVKQVDVPSFSGAFGILPAHVPTLAVLKPGVVTVYEEDGSTNKFFVSLDQSLSMMILQSRSWLRKPMLLQILTLLLLRK
eukprot:TRINITY_DN4893_c0_g1_i1.p1 TRINITY_DN4893_c0_g1~~TRINITY_DN4893_c0_g1_i1.p1  ORF type:complete len:119 (-),score=25.13 TRINITY_DN4893_c0_g1_i1:237-593(-)